MYGDFNLIFYSLCILDTFSIINIDNKNKIFEIKLTFVIYRWDPKLLPGQAEFIFYNSSQLDFFYDYFNDFIEKNKLFLLTEIKKTIFLLDKTIIFD